MTVRKGQGRLLFVHAHPDDESSKGAATAARYADAGCEVVLVTCTGGEAGEILNESYPEVAEVDLADIRAEELAHAVRLIGFTATHHLGQIDSGWHEDLAQVPAGTFAAVPVAGPADALARILRQERPDVVVTYPPDGGYPHPDHIRTYEVTMAAVDRAVDPAHDLDGLAPIAEPRVVYLTGFPRERVAALHEAMVARGLDSPYASWLDGAEERPRRDIDTPPDFRLNVAEWFSRRDAALRAHATQIDPDGVWFAVPRDLEAVAFPWETFVLLRGTPAPVGADDLLAGL